MESASGYDMGHEWILEPLAELASNPKILKPGGSIILLIGQYYIFPQAVAALSKHLNWYGMIAVNYNGQTKDVFNRKVVCSWKPMIWLKNGTSVDPDDMHDQRIIRDSVLSKQPEKFHPHQQSITEFVHVIKSLSVPGDLVVDPFMGSGTTGEAALRCNCRFMGADDGSCLDDGTYETGKSVGDKWVRLAQQRLDGVVAELKAKQASGKPQLLIPPITELPILGATEQPQLTA